MCSASIRKHLAMLTGDWQWHLQEVRQQRELERRGLLKHERGLCAASDTAEVDPDAFSYICGGGRLEDDDDGEAVIVPKLLHVA